MPENLQVDIFYFSLYSLSTKVKNYNWKTLDLVINIWNLYISQATINWYKG